MSRRVTLAESIYPADSLRSAVSAYEGLCSAEVVQEPCGYYSVELNALSHEIDEDHMTNEFLNYLLDLSAEQHLKGRGD